MLFKTYFYDIHHNNAELQYKMSTSGMQRLFYARLPGRGKKDSRFFQDQLNFYLNAI